MTTTDTPDVRPVAAIIAMAGLGLLGAGSYVHLTMGDRTLGNCVETGVCEPWHPTWVLLPVIAGTVLFAVAAVVFVRR